ncbi:MAG: carboxypeptidase-like regulatory domain-containing protein [Chloroflexota bacterium]|nr:carboxypeptidase-like regulatory domain-containing protein [Dehalococcoidia bacterium]MDW8253334.1 carboxypeptidase-like regulatory domain-containing protein [Chloroflexota bacterium]
MLTRRLALSLATLVAVLAAASPARAQGPGAVVGRVVNGSAGGAPVAGVAVTLLPVTTTGPGQRVSATSGPDGTFRFDGLPTEAGRFYVVWAEFEGARYQVGPLQFAPGTAELPVELAVYAPTESDPGIRLTRYVVLIVPSPPQRFLSVLSFVDVENPSSQAYIGQLVGQQRQTLRFGLPAGSRSLQVLEGIQVNAVARTMNGFADTLPVKPGQTTVVFQYLVDYVDNGILFTLPVYHPTQELSLLLAEGDWTLIADGARPSGTVEQGGQRFRSYTATNLVPGQELRAVIQGQGLTSQALGNQPLFTMAVGSAILLVTIAAVAVPLLRRRSRRGLSSPSPRKPPPQASVSPQPALPTAAEPRAEEREALLAALADLDDRHAAGEISDEEWARLRSAKKEALVALIREIRGI